MGPPLAPVDFPQQQVRRGEARIRPQHLARRGQGPAGVPRRQGRLSGANAVLALILNLVILLAFLAVSGAVLTLPGIAGVILTIGMGVDSNVLVFERIREELRYGKSASASVEAGFDKAFLTIIDTHVTTVVSAVFLFLFGTGPIRGFAITLVIGLIANVFTAIFVSKAIFHYHLAKMDRQAELSI